MVDFKRKLSRLVGPGRSGTPGTPADEPATEPTEAGTDAPDAGAPPDREGALDALRDRLAELLQRKPAPRRRAVEPSLDDLPFVREECESGPLFVRRERLGPSTHVGHASVESARSAAAGMLALLALDPGLATVDPARALYLDLETTGLGGGAGVVAFLVGLGGFEDSEFVLEQLMLRQPGEEGALLGRVAERLEAASVVVSYNGKAFDLPTLRGRYVMNRLPAPREPPHLDLLHVGRRLHRARLGQCRLATLESGVLGFVRAEDIDGAEVPQRYAHYLRSGDSEGLWPVVEHNAWDVTSMAALVGLYGEPLERLDPRDLTSLALTLKRARALDEAQQAAEEAVARSGEPAALRARAEIAKARGDRVSALEDFETLCGEVNEPRIRLELAKLYEHHVKAPLRALEWVRQGTGESEEATARRTARLRRKLTKAKR